MPDNNARIYSGRWRVVRELGRGGQGIVYQVEDASNLKANDVSLERFKTILREATASIYHQESESALRELIQLIRKISATTTPPMAALKELLLPDEAVNKNTALDRMKSEIETMRKVKHPSLIDILDEDNDYRWHVTELFSGGTLAGTLDSFKNQVLDSLQALRPVVEAVSRLHQVDIVHRDIKPENVFIDQAGRLVLGDCGLVFLRDGKDRVTETFENVGSRDWMPGWALGQRLTDVQPNFDVFSLGKVLWAMIAGRPILPLWYHRNPEFNLETMFPNNESTAFVQTILDKTVVEKPTDCLTNAAELLTSVDWAIEALTMKFRIVDGDLLRKCLVCGKGNYQKIVDHDHDGQHNFGLRVVSQPKFRIFVCDGCGHSQLFYSTDRIRPRAWKR